MQNMLSSSSMTIPFHRFWIAASISTFIFTLLITATYQLLLGGYSALVDAYNIGSFNLDLQSLFLIVIVSPLLETAFNQLAVISLLKKLRLSNTSVLIISAIIFSCGHFRSGYLSVLNNFFLGLILSFSYTYWLHGTSSKRKAFESSLLIHSAHNFYYYCLTYFLSAS